MGRFGVGFFGFLENSHFWHSDFGKYYRARFRRIILWVGSLTTAAILLWIIIESIRAFPLF